MSSDNKEKGALSRLHPFVSARHPPTLLLPPPGESDPRVLAAAAAASILKPCYSIESKSAYIENSVFTLLDPRASFAF